MSLQPELRQVQQQALQAEFRQVLRQSFRQVLQQVLRLVGRMPAEFQWLQGDPAGSQPRFPSEPALLPALPVGEPVLPAVAGPLPEKPVESVPQESQAAPQPEATRVQPGRARPSLRRAPGITTGVSVCQCFLRGYFCFSLFCPSSFLPVILSAKTSTPASFDTCSTNSCTFFASYSFCSFLNM